MLPTGIPRLALIWAYGIGGSSFLFLTRYERLAGAL